MGPYCNYCGQRCFVPREVPGSRVTILATCRIGALNDMLRLGVDYSTAQNRRNTGQQARSDR